MHVLWKGCLLVAAGGFAVALIAGVGRQHDESNGEVHEGKDEINAVSSRASFEEVPVIDRVRQPLERRVMISGRAYFIKSDPLELNGDALEFVNQRMSSAQAGDGVASYEIHLRTDACMRVVAPGDVGTYQGYARVGLGEQYMQSVERELEACQSLLVRQELLEVNWLEQAAAQGSVEAQLMYAQNPEAILGAYQNVLADPERLIEYRSKAISHLNSALNSGSLDALEVLGDAYDRGIIAPRNAYEAYSHKLALQRLDSRETRDRELSRIKMELSPAQIAEAEATAMRIVNKCCT